MKSLFLKEIVAEIGGKVSDSLDNHIIKHVETTPTRLRNNTLFFNFDKDGEIDWQLYNHYQSCFVVTDHAENVKKLGPNFTVIRVPDIDDAYWKFVSYYRGLFQIPVIGVTGTCGKTTVKEMVEFILSKRYKVQATYLSRNNLRFNLPYLLGIDDEVDAAVFEMGVSSPGDVKTSCRYFQPKIGIITRIGIDHLSGCKTLENYIKAKAEMLEGLGNEGTLILNADDENIKKIDLRPYRGKVLYFGLSETSDYRTVDVSYAESGMEYIFQFKNQKIKSFVPGYGEHNVYNALAAIAAAHTLGFDIKEAAESLAAFRHVKRHLQLFRGIRGCTVIDDTWSSNPTSTEAALKVLKKVSNGRKTVVVIGRMALLGKYAAGQYAKIANMVVELGIDILITIGDEARQIGKKASEMGMDKNNVYRCNDTSEVHGVLHRVLDNQCIVLFKTSMNDSYGDLVKKIIISDEA